MEFGRIMTAMVTPFDENNEIDFEKTKVLVEELIKNNTDTIVVAGTTGESPTLTKNEKLKLFSIVYQQANKRAKVIANIGSNNTEESKLFAREVEELKVADGLMVVNPYYNKPNQKGLYLHYKTVAENTSLPIMMYNIPGRTSVNLSVETVIKLSKIENIKMIKESTGDLSQMAYIIENTPDDFLLYVGDDNLIIPAMSIGAVGVVSVSSHIIGKEIKEMMDDFLSGNMLEASKKHRKLLYIFEKMFFDTNPIVIKEILNLNNTNVGGLRLPLTRIESDSDKEKLNELNNYIKNIKTAMRAT